MRLLLTLLFFAVPSCWAQKPERPVAASSDVLGYANVFGGLVPVAGAGGTETAGMSGVSVGAFHARPAGTLPGFAPEVEVGLIGPIPRGRSLDGLVGANAIFRTQVPHRSTYLFLAAGLTRVFLTGFAVDAGFGIEFNRPATQSVLRLEVRDSYLLVPSPAHLISLRFAFSKSFGDV